jgi:hypothetical protein
MIPTIVCECLWLIEKTQEKVVPYKSISELPGNVPKAYAKQFLEVFNSAYAAAKADNKSDSDAEAWAFMNAHGVINKAKAKDRDLSALNGPGFGPTEKSSEDGGQVSDAQTTLRVLEDEWKAACITLRFADDQPRDPDGKFASGSTGENAHTTEEHLIASADHITLAKQSEAKGNSNTAKMHAEAAHAHLKAGFASKEDKESVGNVARAASKDANAFKEGVSVFTPKSPEWKNPLARDPKEHIGARSEDQARDSDGKFASGGGEEKDADEGKESLRDAKAELDSSKSEYDKLHEQFLAAQGKVDALKGKLDVAAKTWDDAEKAGHFSDELAANHQAAEKAYNDAVKDRDGMATAHNDAKAMYNDASKDYGKALKEELAAHSKRYSEDQPRETDGKFGSGSSSSPHEHETVKQTGKLAELKVGDKVKDTLGRAGIVKGWAAGKTQVEVGGKLEYWHASQFQRSSQISDTVESRAIEYRWE